MNLPKNQTDNQRWKRKHFLRLANTKDKKEDSWAIKLGLNAESFFWFFLKKNFFWESVYVKYLDKWNDWIGYDDNKIWEKKARHDQKKLIDR